MFLDVEKRYAILVWNPKVGYSCSACSWTNSAHIQTTVPVVDETSEQVRKEFAEHIREEHS